MKMDLLDETTHKEKMAEWLTLAVENLPVTQRVIAEHCGVSETRLSNFLAGRNYPSNYFMYRLCALYPVTPEFLLMGEIRGATGSLGDALRAVSAASSPALKVPARQARGNGKTASKL